MDVLNQHAKEIGSNIVIVSGPNKSATKEELSAKVCAKCGKSAEFKSNFLGKEKLLCSKHAEQTRAKNENLPQDLWFVKAL